MEKRRRDRMNRSLDRLRLLLLAATRDEVRLCRDYRDSVAAIAALSGLYRHCRGAIGALSCLSRLYRGSVATITALL